MFLPMLWMGRSDLYNGVVTESVAVSEPSESVSFSFTVSKPSKSVAISNAVSKPLESVAVSKPSESVTRAIRFFVGQ